MDSWKIVEPCRGEFPASQVWLPNDISLKHRDEISPGWLVAEKSHFLLVKSSLSPLNTHQLTT
jgi:hypothetical protein